MLQFVSALVYSLLLFVYLLFLALSAAELYVKQTHRNRPYRDVNVAKILFGNGSYLGIEYSFHYLCMDILRPHNLFIYFFAAICGVITVLYPA
jgi:hypothetical protein